MPSYHFTKMEGKKGNIRQGHPLLRGKQRERGEYTHGLSQAQIQSLSAICAAFIPSVPTEDLHVSNGKESPPSKALQEFYMASGADFNIPDEVPLSISDISHPVFLFLSFIFNFFFCLPKFHTYPTKNLKLHISSFKIYNIIFTLLNY